MALSYSRRNRCGQAFAGVAGDDFAAPDDDELAPSDDLAPEASDFAAGFDEASDFESDFVGPSEDEDALRESVR
jgi:hypothetical protein